MHRSTNKLTQGNTISLACECQQRHNIICSDAPFHNPRQEDKLKYTLKGTFNPEYQESSNHPQSHEGPRIHSSRRIHAQSEAELSYISSHLGLAK
jgi:hypothetical protein